MPKRFTTFVDPSRKINVNASQSLCATRTQEWKIHNIKTSVECWWTNWKYMTTDIFLNTSFNKRSALFYSILQRSQMEGSQKLALSSHFICASLPETNNDTSLAHTYSHQLFYFLIRNKWCKTWAVRTRVKSPNWFWTQSCLSIKCLPNLA